MTSTTTPVISRRRASLFRLSSLWETKTGLVYNFMGAEDYIHKGGFKKHVPLLEEVVVMEGVAYFINEEKPDEINQHIHDFDHQEISVIR
ncbi:hypothetical protein M0R45_011150 [Rubus argutus]|uniref:Uncharacterized protein n=1 Tax=Rubus argutus TaxID=59490 RepID=A0AAW1Y911_RUBAR